MKSLFLLIRQTPRRWAAFRGTRVPIPGGGISDGADAPMRGGEP